MHSLELGAGPRKGTQRVRGRRGARVKLLAVREVAKSKIQQILDLATGGSTRLLTGAQQGLICKFLAGSPH